jgi:phenylacetate-CoA ligase
MFIFSFASYLDDQNYDGSRLGLKAAVVSAEYLDQNQINLINKVFGCPVLNEYGSTECGVIAYDHPCGEMHLMDDYILSEIIKAGSEHEYGEIVITNLENWGSPLIRYNLEDLVTPSENQGKCSLNLGLATINNIVGRHNDILKLPDGKLVHGHTISNSMKFMPSVRQYQIVHNKKDSIDMLLVTEEGQLTPQEEQYLRGKLHENLHGMHINIQLVDQIPRDESGKFRYIRSEITD